MLFLSKIQPTTMRVAFSTSNSWNVGYTSVLIINGQSHTIAHVVNGTVATITISVEDALGISTDFFLADIIVYDKDDKEVMKLRESGRVFNRELTDEEKFANVIPVLIRPEFRVPNGGMSLETSMPMVVNKTSGGTTTQYEIDIVDDDKGIDLMLKRK